MHDLPFDIASLRAAYGNGATPEGVVREVYRRIADQGDGGIFIHLADENCALETARALPTSPSPDMPLWGIPFAVKDNIDVAGMATTAACPAFSYRPVHDSQCVARLRRSGAIPLGKTNLDQFATGLVGVRSPFPPPLNALDPTIVPGGSSSGSAVAVACGLVSFALGTDTAGSGRVPAALNNVVGIKPSLGLVSGRGVVPACRTLDTVSVFALGVEDAWQVLQAMAAFDPSDAYARSLPLHPLAPSAAGRRVGVPARRHRHFFGDSRQAASFEDSLAEIEALGCELVEIDFEPFFEVGRLLYDGPWVAERFTVVEALLRTMPDAIHPVTRQVIEMADGISAADAFRAIHRLAELKRDTAEAMSGTDMLCVPSIPTFCSLGDIARDPIAANARLGTYTQFVNLLDLCGVTVPMAPRSDGRPGSVTLLAPAGQDHVAGGLAAQLHAAAGVSCGATAWPVPLVNRHPPQAGGDEITIAVVGAHMTGLPLNHELTDRGGRLLRRDTTAPCYRLYALPGGPPHKPGLLRAADGAAIDLEIWAMPEGRMGGFMRNVPQPLAIGTLTLASGEEVKGFLCESNALDDALEITRHGGWRGYLASLGDEARRPDTVA